MGRRTLRTGRPNLDSSPPGGWAKYHAEEYIEDRRRERNRKVKGKWMLVLEKPSGAKITEGPMSYSEAMNEKYDQEPRELKLGPLAGHYTVKKYRKIGLFRKKK